MRGLKKMWRSWGLLGIEADVEDGLTQGGLIDRSAFFIAQFLGVQVHHGVAHAGDLGGGFFHSGFSMAATHAVDFEDLHATLLAVFPHIDFHFQWEHH